MSKLKPFDLEKAKAGEKFTHYHDPECMTVRKFLAVRSDGLIVYESPLPRTAQTVTNTIDPQYLRMVVEPKKIKIRLYCQPNRILGFEAVVEDHWSYYEKSTSSWILLKEFEVEYDDE